MERHDHNVTTYHGIDTLDPMDVTREDSPATVLGDSSPRLTPLSPTRGIDVIDLEATDRRGGFEEDDYLTDKQFEERFLNPPRANGALQRPGMRPKDTASVDGRTYRRGKTVELHSGDFIRIMNILEDDYTGDTFLQGFRLRRLSQCRRLFDQHLNELTMVFEETNADIQTSESGSMEVVSSFEVLRIRDVILTNAAFSSFSCREDASNSMLPRDVLRDQGRLVCRWKLKVSIRPQSNGRQWIEKSVSGLTATEADVKFRLDDEHLRRRWRGITIKKGSCASWLRGERDFDLRERSLHRDLLTPPESDRVGRRTQRYTFGDAFCGAGGCSRGAKSAGLRVVWGFDSNLASIDSYAKNFFGARCEATPADVFLSVLNDNFCVDVLHLSPPCQPYSPAHTRLGKDDEMNEATFFAVGEIIKKSKPRVVTLENTFGLAQRRPEWMDAMYGVPQARRRLVVIASCPGEELPGFPQPTHGTNLHPFSTVNEAIQRIPEGFPNHDPNSAARRNLAAYNGNLPLRNCITTGGSLDTHPNGRRGFTVRELACLQTFPLEHKFETVGLKKQIGNAVPSLFAQVLFSHIRRWLEEADG